MGRGKQHPAGMDSPTIKVVKGLCYNLVDPHARPCRIVPRFGPDRVLKFSGNTAWRTKCLLGRPDILGIVVGAFFNTRHPPRRNPAHSLVDLRNCHDQWPSRDANGHIAGDNAQTFTPFNTPHSGLAILLAIGNARVLQSYSRIVFRPVLLG